MAASDKDSHQIQLDEYEADLEKHAGEAKFVDEAQKSVHLEKLNLAAENYIKS